jgi:hypothetical protein
MVWILIVYWVELMTAGLVSLMAGLLWAKLLSSTPDVTTTLILFHLFILNYHALFLKCSASRKLQTNTYYLILAIAPELAGAPVTRENLSIH